MIAEQAFRTRLARIALAALVSCTSPVLSAQTATLTIDVSGPGKAISPDLFGIFFEDLNYAADGGLYAELVQNRSFEYSPTEQSTWHPLSFWELQKRGGGEGGVRWRKCDPSIQTIRITRY